MSDFICPYCDKELSDPEECNDPSKYFDEIDNLAGDSLT